MAGFVYIPRATNPWDNMLPNMLSNMIMANMQQKFYEQRQERAEAIEEKKWQREQDLLNEPIKVEPIKDLPGKFIVRSGGKSTVVDKEEELPKGYFKVGSNLIRDLGGGKVEFITPDDKEKITTDMTNYQFALKNGYKGSFIDYMQQGKQKISVETNVNLPDIITPKVKGELQTKIADADEAIDALNQVQDPKIFKREFLEYFGKGKAKLAELTDKAGYGVANQYLAEYTGWKSMVDKQKLAYRKAVTGVAGGKEEMEAIEKTYINTSSDSPVMFMKKAQVMRENAMIAKERARFTLEHFNKDWKDLSPQEKQDVSKKFPYITKITLDRAEIADQEAEEYLRSLQK